MKGDLGQMKRRLLISILAGLFSFIILSCGDEESGVRSSQKIESAMREYFGEDDEYLYKEKIDFSSPSIIRIIAAKRPDLEVATFDVYWVGRTSDAQQVKVMSDDDALGNFEIENFEQGTIDDPVVEEHTGHGMFVMPISEFEKLVEDSKTAFQLVTEEGRHLGDVFLSNEIQVSKHGVYGFERLKNKK